MLDDLLSLGIAGVCAWGGVIISIYQILCHLRNYTEPTFQRYIVRIIFMVPNYAITSWLSMVNRGASIYFDTVRDCYEAWVIYNFLALCLAYVGGPGAVVIKAEGKIVEPSWKHTTCCLPAMAVDGFFLRRCKQGALQFVIIKPILAALTLILYAAGKYEDGVWAPDGGYLYLAIMYNVCYTIALYSLLLFYIGTDELLQPFNPLLKFVLVKTVIFLTFWQGIAISMICSWGKIKDPSDGKALQNFMICLEMIGASVMMLYAFPHTEYNIGGAASGMNSSALGHAISIRDVVSDTVHQFAPAYHDYVLYSDGGPAENTKRKKFRGQENSEHPKANLMRNMEGGQLSAIHEEVGSQGSGGGRRSPERPRSHLDREKEVGRRQAVLVDSDSDAEDSEPEDNTLGVEMMSDEEEGSGPASNTPPRTSPTMRR